MGTDPSQIPADGSPVAPDPAVPDPAPVAADVPPAAPPFVDPLTGAESVNPPLVQSGPDGPLDTHVPDSPGGLPAVDSAGNPTADSPVTTPPSALSPIGSVLATDNVTPVAPGDVATAPSTGETILTPDNSVIVPLSAVDQNQAAINDPNAPVVAAHEDPHGAASAVLAKEAAPTPEVIQTRSELSAQSVVDQGTLTPQVAGSAIAPVETLDHHTVDPSGTADDHQPGAFFERERTDEKGDPIVSTDEATSTVDTRVALVDRSSAKGQTLLPPALGEELVTSSVKALAENGFHRDLIHQWVDQAYADLQGQNQSAAQAGDEIPFPSLAS